MRASVALTATLVALDQSRLQPWVYQYCLFLIVLSVIVDKRRALDTCRFLLIALYFWSAVQKMNFTFIHRTWPDVCPMFPRVGWLIPLMELSIAAGLAIPQFRRKALVAAIGMHAVILVMLVIAGENSVVWPWNIALAALALTLFSSSDAVRPHKLVALVAGVLPVLSLMGLWDAYLSGALYSGNTIQSVILVTPESVSRFPRVVQENTWLQSPPYFVDINRWSFDELNVPAYPAERVMKAVGREACENYIPPDQATLRILGRPDWRTGTRSASDYQCLGLLATR